MLVLFLKNSAKKGIMGNLFNYTGKHKRLVKRLLFF